MQENYENVTSLGFPVSKSAVTSQLEGEKELLFADLQSSEERDTLSGSCTGTGMVSETVKQNPQQEDDVEPHGALLQRYKRPVPRSCEKSTVCKSQHKPAKLQGNQPVQKTGKSAHTSLGESHKSFGQLFLPMSWKLRVLPTEISIEPGVTSTRCCPGSGDAQS
ncbi:uncharacterized protein LOC112543745 isoform X2 [Pelodiscus sinensis]|uniref:uncharacterized protein LOC112543745 isoform X2 n=1 Tax=Pelodiscus sinensis TaxID=13735 RepID=UPI003F6AEFE8